MSDDRWIDWADKAILVGKKGRRLIFWTQKKAVKKEMESEKIGSLLKGKVFSGFFFTFLSCILGSCQNLIK